MGNYKLYQGNYKLQLSAFFIIFPEYKSNDQLRVRLYLQFTIVSVTSFIYLYQMKATFE